MTYINVLPLHQSASISPVGMVLDQLSKLWQWGLSWCLFGYQWYCVSWLCHAILSFENV